MGKVEVKSPYSNVPIEQETPNKRQQWKNCWNSLEKVWGCQQDRTSEQQSQMASSVNSDDKENGSGS